MKGFLATVRRILFADIWRKLLALVFAILVYAAAESRLAEPAKLTKVPVEIILPPGLQRLNKEPVVVELSVRGNRPMLRRVHDKKLAEGHAKVQEKDFRSGVPYKLRLTPEDFIVPLGVHVTEVKPDVLILQLQRIITRQIPVRATFRGQLGADYERQKVVCVPPLVEVTGPESQVAGMKEILTEEIPLDASVTETFGYKVKLRNSGDLLFNVKDREVDVQVSIVKTFVTRRFVSLPVRLLIPPGAPQSLRTAQPEIEAVEVEVKGIKSQIGTLQREEVRPYIDLSRDRAPGVYEMKVSCFVNGDQADVKKITPATIKVKISK